MGLMNSGHPEAAGEMLWGAVDRITQAVARYHGLTGKRKPVVRWMDNYPPAAVSLAQNVDSVGRLHGHFCNSHLTPQVHLLCLGTGLRLIRDLLNHPQTRAIP